MTHAAHRTAKTATEQRLGLRSLVARHFGGHNHLVAATVRQLTGRTVSQRTVQAWLMQEGSSSRNCPSDTYEALERWIAEPANQAALSKKVAILNSSGSRQILPFERAAEVEDRLSVMLADGQLRHAERSLLEWQGQFGVAAGQMLFVLEQKLDQLSAEHAELLEHVEYSLRESTTVEEMRQAFDESRRGKSLIHFHIRHAKQAIQSEGQDFEDNDGLAQD